MSEVESKIRGFLGKDLGLDVDSLESDTPLFTSGLVDSFSLIELLSFLESDLKVQIDITEVGIDELDSIGSLTKLAQS